MPGHQNQTPLQIAFALGDAKMIKLLMDFDPRQIPLTEAVSQLSNKEITNKAKLSLLNKISLDSTKKMPHCKLIFNSKTRIQS